MSSEYSIEDGKFYIFGQEVTEHKFKETIESNGGWYDPDRKLAGVSVKSRSNIEDIVSPDAPITTNEKGGSQSQVDVRFDLIDARAMFAMAKVLDHGAKKYGANNWRNIDIDDHLNHLLMHTFAFLAGDRTDDHLSHILCRATFALGVSLQEPQSFADTIVYGVDSNHDFDQEYGVK